MVDLIIDTDIGNDCDDAGALAIAHNLANKGFCNILAITSDTSRLDGAQAIQIINQHYQRFTPVGMTQRTGFLDERQGYGAYSRCLVENYGHYLNGQPIEDAVSLLRKTLAQATSKVKIICLCPLNNIAELMQSKPCLYSPLDGFQLILEKVASFVIMGGEFNNDETYYVDGNLMRAEWNVLQDLDAAQYVINNLEVPAFFIPYSVGLVKTGHTLFEQDDYESPIKLSYQIHSKGPRQSWDPITIYYAVMGAFDLFEMSENGTVSIDASGITTFKADPLGKHRYMKRVIDEDKVVEILNRLML